MFTCTMVLCQVERRMITLCVCLGVSAGLQCPLGQAYLGTNNAASAEHYVGVLRTVSHDSQVRYPTAFTTSFKLCCSKA